MIGLLRRLGWIGGLAAFARSAAGQRIIAKVKAYATNPDNRRKLNDLAGNVSRKNTK